MSNLKFNVAQLLRETIGVRRDHTFSEQSLPLDDGLTLRDIVGHVRFTRTMSGVVAHITVHGLVRLTCVRSLEEFDQEINLDVEDEFHSVIDVISGVALPKPAEEDPFFLDMSHLADIGEAIREYTLLELPINPVCEAYRDHPISYTIETSDRDEETDKSVVVDKRLEVLKTWADRQNQKS